MRSQLNMNSAPSLSLLGWGTCWKYTSFQDLILSNLFYEFQSFVCLTKSGVGSNPTFGNLVLVGTYYEQ